jgi:hypothetical protein
MIYNILALIKLDTLRPTITKSATTKISKLDFQLIPSITRGASTSVNTAKARAAHKPYCRKINIIATIRGNDIRVPITDTGYIFVTAAWPMDLIPTFTVIGTRN